jgi:glycine/D-amino acid oxidase-like deaminating enzyme/nitrite reductase/ring-hydroxylating ferredoxin subunit
MAIHLDTTPYWIDTAAPQRFPRLERDEAVDVVIVGGGLTGLTAAYLLLAAGKSVALLERRRLGESETGHTTAHLTMVTDLPMTDLVAQFGRPHAQAAWDAGLAAIAQVDAIARNERIDCDFAWVPGYLHAPPDDDGRDEEWLREDARIAAELGFDATFVADVPLVHKPGVRFEDQARFHPHKYMAGLARAIVRNGGHIYEESEATEFSEEPRAVCAHGHRISCRDVIIATHNPLVGNQALMSATLLQTKLALYSTYVVAGRVEKSSAPDALLWDSADPYHYYRLEPGREFDFVVYGGEDHKTGQATDTVARYERLERGLQTLLPDVAITHHWSGQVVETHDGLPYIGEQTSHQYTGTGYSGNGMTFGTLGAMMACDGILGRRNPWRELFAIDRKKLSAVWDYLKENADYPYYLIRDRFAGAEGRSVRTVKRGEGKIIDFRATRVAAYRDSGGAVTLRSPVCTHMGCSVAWNAAEQTWDCPCHGSRFTATGAVISGPAETPLRDLPASKP